jgi:hypothetical protein
MICQIYHDKEISKKIEGVYLAHMCLGRVDGEKPQVVLRLGKHSYSDAEQNQSLFF